MYRIYILAEQDLMIADHIETKNQYAIMLIEADAPDCDGVELAEKEILRLKKEDKNGYKYTYLPIR